MAISVLPLELSDVPASAILELEAFRSHPRIPMLWRAGYTPDLYAYYESNKRASLADPFYRMMKAVDDETGDLLAVAEWVFVFDRPAYEKEKKAFDPEAAPPENWPRDGNWALKQFFAGNLEKWEGEWLGEGAYGKLEILVTHPDFQGRGAGSKLLEWGVQEADKHGVRMALESTPAGLSMYKRVGFREADVVKADMRQFGWEQPYDEEAAKRV